MQVRRLGPLLIPAALLVNAMMLSCGGGSSSVAVATANPPGPRLRSITVCDGPPASPMFSPVPPAPCSGAVSDSLAQADTIAFHAVGENTNRVRKDLTDAKTTLWTSDNPGVAQTVVSQPGVFVGIAQGCACIAASSGGISSNVVSLAVFASATPDCTPCPAVVPTPILSSTATAGAPTPTVAPPVASPTASAPPTPTPAPTLTPVPTSTPAPTATPAPTITETPTPTAAPTITETPTPTAAPTTIQSPTAAPT